MADQTYWVIIPVVRDVGERPEQMNLGASGESTATLEDLVEAIWEVLRRISQSDWMPQFGKFRVQRSRLVSNPKSEFVWEEMPEMTQQLRDSFGAETGERP